MLNTYCTQSKISGFKDNESRNVSDPEIKCSQLVLTGLNWNLAITSLQFRTGFCACWYPARSHTLDKSHTAASTDVATVENFKEASW